MVCSVLWRLAASCGILRFSGRPVRFCHFQVQKICRSARSHFTRGREYSGAHTHHGPYKPRTGRCMNHITAILAGPVLIYSMHRLLVVWIIVAYFPVYLLIAPAGAPATPDCRQAGVAGSGRTHRLHRNVRRCEPLRPIV